MIPGYTLVVGSTFKDSSGNLLSGTLNFQPVLTNGVKTNYRSGQAVTGLAAWAAGTAYAQGNVALGADGNPYVSLAAGNTGNAPVTVTSGQPSTYDTVHWLRIPPGCLSPGQTSNSPVQAAVTNGAFALLLPDTTLTYPENIGFAVTGFDEVTNERTLGQGYNCFQPSGAVCNWDTYDPNLAPQATVQTGPAGLSAYQVWLAAGNTGTQAQYLASLQGSPGTNGVNGTLTPDQVAASQFAQTGGTNVFNAATVTSPGYCQTSGVVGTDNGAFAASDFIATGGVLSIATLGPLSGSYGPVTSVAYYDANKATLGGNTGAIAAKSAIALPAGVAYVKVTVAASAVSQTMIVLGAGVPTAYAPYQQSAGIVAAASTAAGQGSAAIQYINQLLAVPVVNLFYPAKATTGSLVRTDTGAIDTGLGSSYTVSARIGGIIPGQTYTLLQTYSQNNSTYGLVWFDAKGNFLSSVGWPFTTGQLFVAPVGAVFVQFGWDSGGVATGQVFALSSTALTTYVAPPAIPTTSGAIPVSGQRCGVWGNSLSSPGFMPTTWQSVVTARNGANFAVQDSRPGRDFLHWFEQYGTITPGATPGTYSASATGGGYQTNGVSNADLNSVGETAGNTLAQNLAGVKLLIIEGGTNDANAIQGGSLTLGALGDATSAGTFYGNLRWAVETLQNANLTMRLLLVTPAYNGFDTSTGKAYTQQVVTAMLAYGASMGIPVLNLFANSGINALTSSTLTQDGTHWNTAGVQNNVGPAIANFIDQWF